MRLLLKVVPDGARNDFSYFFGKLTVILSLEETLDLPAGGSFSLYNDRLYLLLYVEAIDKQINRKGNAFKVAFKESCLWIPGRYFLLFRSGDMILRFDILLDEHGVMSETGSRQCSKLSDEDILSGILDTKRFWIKCFSQAPGVMQWKRWVINRLKERTFNAIRSEYHYYSLDYCNNLLISAPSTDYLSRNILLLINLADIKCEIKSADCSTLYDASSSNPFYEIERLFQVEEEDNKLDLSLPSMKERLFCFRNISALLEPDKECALQKILSKCPSHYNAAVFCGTQEDIDRLLERVPSLRDQFLQCNRIAVEPYALDELIRLFFYEVSLANLWFSPEATDAACRLLSERYQQGTIRHWTLTDVRQRVRCHILPAYRQRVITSIQQGANPAEVLDVQPEDLFENHVNN